MNPIKISHIVTVDFTLRYLILNLLRTIKHAGYDTSAISAPGDNVPAIESVGIRHIPVPMRRRVTPIADLVALWRLYRVFCLERFTIVQTHTPKANLLGQIAARLANVPIRISSVHGFYFTPQTPWLKRVFFQAIETISAFFAHLVLMLNPDDVETAKSLRICAPAKIRLLEGGLGIDIDRFSRSAVNDATLFQTRLGLGLAFNSQVVGFVGRLVREKGVLEFMRAAQIVLQIHPDVRFLIVGPVDHDKPDVLTPEVAQRFGIAEACVFTGLRNDMPELYALMDIFVLPSHREGLPRSPMEASAMGVPCVVTDIRGCRETVRNGRNGLLVPVGDALALADAIGNLLANAERRKQMGEAGRQMAIERFDEKKVFEKIQTEYAYLLQVKGVTILNRQV